MRKIFLFLFVAGTALLHSQTAADLFTHNDIKVSWLGIDFSHAKLVGNFSEFSAAGEKSSVQIRDKFFPAWNRLVLNEPDKYDLKGMLRKDNLIYDIDDVTRLNSQAPLEDMETYNPPTYTSADVSKFVSQYSTEGKEGLGVVFIAEVLNKTTNEAYYHFTLINMKTKEVLITERVRSEPTGIGLRNFWGGSIYRAIKDVRDTRYMTWKRKYAAKK